MRQIEHKSVPDIRFPGFDKPWALQKVGDFVSEHREKSKQDNQHEVLTSSRAGLQPQSEYFGENRLTERDNTGFNVIPPNYITYRSRSDNREFFFNENNLGIHGIISVYYPVFRISGGNNQFFTELLNSKRHHVGRYSVGTSQTVLSLNDLRSIRFPIPCEDEQHKIAGFLGAVYERIAQVTRKKALLEDYKKGCMQQLFSQSTRFKDDQGNDFPDWKEKRLGEVASINPKSDKIPDNFLYIDLESVSQGRLTSPKPETPETAPSRAQRLLARHDILFQLVRPYQRNNFYFDDDQQHVASTGYAQLRAKESSAFLYQAVHESRFVNRVLERCTGTNYPAINSNDLAKVVLHLPHPDEQQKIADFLSAIDTKIDLVARELEQAKTFKKGLLQQMFV